MKISFTGELWFWRGPSPFHFISVPMNQSSKIKEISSQVTYGWGAIPATVSIGKTVWSTSLFPKDGVYLVPIKNAIRFEENLILGDEVSVTLEIN